MALSEKSQSGVDVLTSNPIATRLADVYQAFSERREALGLSNPGTVENLAKEVQQNVFLNNQTFTGLRADLTKIFGAGSPLFQVSHSLAMGSQALPPYSYAVLYGTPKVFMQANLDSDLQLLARLNYRWSQAFVSKMSAQIAPGGPGQSMFSFENAYTGADFSAGLKAMNPSILDGGLTGIFVGSYLQSVTPRLALGLESIWQRVAVNQGPDMLTSYAARYKGDDWVGSAQLLAQGGMQASYWRRLADKVEAGVDVNLQFAGLGLAKQASLMGGMPKNEGTTTIGAKYDFRQSSFRAQIDNTGRLGCLLEKQVAPMVRLTFAGELDHAKNQAKLGLAVSIEAADEEVMQASEANGSTAPPVPF